MRVPYPALLAILAQLVVCATIIDPTRRTVWQGNVGVEGGIPIRTNIYQVVPLGTSAADIEWYCNHAPSNSVVLLTNGTFFLERSIQPGGLGGAHGVTLRGMGTNTLMKWTNSVGVNALIEPISPYRGSEPQADTNFVRAVDSGLTQGSTHITIRSPGTGIGAHYDLKVGTLICLDQQNDLDGAGVNNVGYDGAFVPTTEQIRENGNRAQMERYVVTAIDSSGTNLTISPGIAMTNWMSIKNPQIWWQGDSLLGFGIEDLAIDGENGVHEYGILFHCSQNGWVKNVDMRKCKTGDVATFNSFRIEVRDSYFHDSKLGGAGGYGVVVLLSGGMLVENNIFNAIPAPIVADVGASQFVIGYNFATNNPYSPSATWMSASLVAHKVYAHMGLWEGNDCNGVNFDFIHGSGGSHTVHRNRLFGNEEGHPKTDNTFGAFVWATNRNDNFVGNVIGTVGYHVNYEWLVTAPNPSNSAKTIWRVGHYGNNQGQNEGDAITVSTLLRHGNWDAVNQAVVWDSGIPDHIIPPSYYLTGKPAWWPVGEAWPYVGPDLVPISTKSPARERFEAMGGGGGGGSTAPVNISGSVQFTGAVNIHTQ